MNARGALGRRRIGIVRFSAMRQSGELFFPVVWGWRWCGGWHGIGCFVGGAAQQAIVVSLRFYVRLRNTLEICEDYRIKINAIN